VPNVTKDKNELMMRWMQLNMNLMILKSIKDEEQVLLKDMKDELVVWHSYMMDFFDKLGASVEGMV